MLLLQCKVNHFMTLNACLEPVIELSYHEKNFIEINFPNKGFPQSLHSLAFYLYSAFCWPYHIAILILTVPFSSCATIIIRFKFMWMMHGNVLNENSDIKRFSGYILFYWLSCLERLRCAKNSKSLKNDGEVPKELSPSNWFPNI